MMKVRIICILFGLVSISMTSQKDSKTLVEIDGEKISIAEFKSVYEKNLNLVESKDERELEKNLDLFINYKLKIKQAFELKLDTSKTYRREIESYKNQLYAPYLKDDKILDSLVKQAYERSKKEIKASHILVRLKSNATPKDTLDAHAKIMKARQRILKGESFAKVAKEISEDRSVLRNQGDLGYFTAFKMVKDFEDAAYKTEKGSISMPFRTQFGYHIMKVFDVRASLGERKVAHILITGDKKVGRQKIDSLLLLIKNGAKFEELAKKFSNDIASKAKGGVLPRFGTGRFVPAFENAAFSLKEKNQVSEPVESRVGWHIIKLLEVYSTPTLEEANADLRKKLKQNGSFNISRKAMLKKLRKTYKVEEIEKSKSIFKNKNIRGLKKDSLQSVLFRIEDKKFTQYDFVKYLLNRRHKTVDALYQMFLDEKVLEHYKENLINTEPEFARTLKEYEEGILLFELMKQKIWDKSSDSLSLSQFYESKKLLSTYSKPLDSIKGIVINDFQKDLEKKWIADLRNESVITIHKRRFNRLKKFYATKED